MAGVVLNDAPAGLRGARAVVLQDLDLLQQQERLVAAADTGRTAATEMSDVLEGLEGSLGLARCICAGTDGFLGSGVHALRRVAVLARQPLPECGGGDSDQRHRREHRDGHDRESSSALRRHSYHDQSGQHYQRQRHDLDAGRHRRAVALDQVGDVAVLGGEAVVDEDAQHGEPCLNGERSCTGGPASPRHAAVSPSPRAAP